MIFLVLRSFYEERNLDDLELHGMESQPGMDRYSNSTLCSNGKAEMLRNFAHNPVNVCYIEICLKEIKVKFKY